MDRVPEIPGYRIEEKIGEGGMAAVYLGFQLKLKRRVAVKILDPTLLKDKSVARRFLKEAETAANLSHPHIVTIHDVGQSDNRFYIVMEYLEESLKDRIGRRGRMEPPRALEIIRQIAGALDYAHGRGIVHRDIKPDNIMFKNDGTAVLADFGIARAVDATTRLTKTGMSIGTPHYMSPELCRGEKVDGRSDIYSLGVVLYEMLCGKIPFEAENTVGVIVKHLQEPVPRLNVEGLDRPLLHALQSLLDKMMAKTREDRVQSGGELMRAIDDILQLPSAAPSGRRTVPVILAALLVILVGLLLVVLSRDKTSPRLQPDIKPVTKTDTDTESEKKVSAPPRAHIPEHLDKEKETPPKPIKGEQEQVVQDDEPTGVPAKGIEILDRDGERWILKSGLKQGVKRGQKGYFWKRVRSGKRWVSLNIAKFRVVEVADDRCYVQLEHLGWGYAVEDFQWATF